MNQVKVRINEDNSISLWKNKIEVDASWRDAVETEEEPIVTTRQLVIPKYDLESTPIGISYSVLDASFAERKSNEIRKLKTEFLEIVSQQAHNEIANDSEILDISIVEHAKIQLNATVASIESATTHEELDALV